MIVQSKDKNAVGELVESPKIKTKTSGRCIKVLYEMGVEQPAVIKDYITDFTALLSDKNNRLAGGGMTVLNHIAAENPDAILNYFLP